ncbi:hypothetical protein [Pseudomonas indica]|uniref:hypothetical protein n=1 Tax=Pseudomonas indica TaxID=137658 RepID=UPI0023F6954C|nr:hypothetical protein [Pseudomonas indica]MBU3055532.1 hypothetical protein [Pseudomonas indica]
MSLQALWSLVVAYPQQSINTLALLFGLAGGWLLIATRLREQRAMARLVAESELETMEGDAPAMDEPTRRLNQFFNRFGYACLSLALAVSWFSTRV